MDVGNTAFINVHIAGSRSGCRIVIEGPEKVGIGTVSVLLPPLPCSVGSHANAKGRRAFCRGGAECHVFARTDETLAISGRGESKCDEMRKEKSCFDRPGDMRAPWRCFDFTCSAARHLITLPPCLSHRTLVHDDNSRLHQGLLQQDCAAMPSQHKVSLGTHRCSPNMHISFP